MSEQKFVYTIYGGPIKMIVIDTRELSDVQKQQLVYATKDYVKGKHYFEIPIDEAEKLKNFSTV